MKQAQCDQAKMELSNKPWLDQTSNQYNSDHNAHSHLK